MRRFFSVCLLIVFPLLNIPAQSTTKADTLFSEAVEAYNGQDYFHALEHLEEAVGLYRVSHGERSKEFAYAWGWIGEIYRIQNQFEKALPYFLDASDILKDIDVLSSALYDGNAGVCLLALERYGEAEEFLLRAYETSGNLQQTWYVALWGGHLGELYINSRQPELALQYSKESYDLARAQNDEYLTFVSGTNLANSLNELNRLEEALRYYRPAFRKAVEWQYFEGLFEIGDPYGSCLIHLNRAKDAVDVYSSCLDSARAIGDLQQETSFSNLIGAAHSKLGNYEEALKHFERAVVISKELNDQTELSSGFNNIGSVYHHLGRLEKAVEYYSRSLEIDTALGNMRDIAIVLSNRAGVFETWGRYLESLESYNEAIRIAREDELWYDLPVYLGNAANVFMAMGDFAKAEIYLNEALEIIEEQGIFEARSSLYTIYGNYSYITGKLEDAEHYFQEAITIDTELGNEVDAAINLINLGSIYSDREDYEAAEKYYLRAERVFRENDTLNRLGSALNNLGTLYDSLEQYDKALAYFQQTLEIDGTVLNFERMLQVYANIGILYFKMEKYRDAREYFSYNVAYLDELRSQMPDQVKRDILAANIICYQNLMMSHFYLGDVNDALAVYEEFTAAYLEEQISARTPELDEILKRISGKPLPQPEGRAVMAYAAFNRDKSFVFILREDNVYMYELRKYRIADEIEEEIGRNVTRTFRQEESLKRLAALETAEESVDRRFEQYILYYRYLLSRPFLPRRQQQDLEYLSTKFYELLVEPMLEDLEGIDHLTFIPDGALAFLPYETMRTRDGRYLIEDYDCAYAVSNATKIYLEERQLPEFKNSLLAFGGAIYRPDDYEQSTEVSEQHLAVLRSSNFTNTQRGSELATFRSLGLNQWENLPGALAEVRAIAGLRQNADLILGEEVSESTVLELSSSGSLASYEVVHFATHGIVVPEIPELSSLVMSQIPGQEEDGYLTAREISRLDLKAKFVNLSACQTGLGKIYPGEGVAGLIHSFLIAGANAVSVSLWSVADESTMEFMVGMYSLVFKEGMTYNQAINEMKRRFIVSERFQSPYYWGPFVFYGKSQ